MSLMQVADRAGVSVATVSRVINEDPRISAKTAALVRAAIKDLDYTPPPPTDGRRRRARARIGRLNNRIALLFPDHEAGAMRTILASSLIDGMDDPVHDAGLSLLITRLVAPNQLPDCIVHKEVDGIIIRAASNPQWYEERLREIPHVWVFEINAKGVQADIIQPDDMRVGQLAAEHLLERRHRKLIVITDSPNNPAHANRIEAFEREAQRAGASLRVVSLDGGRPEAIRPLVQETFQRSERPTGLFMPGCNPWLTYAHQQLVAMGLMPGRDIDMIGCDHAPENIALLDPPIANINLPFAEVGSAAVEVLLWRMAHRDASPRHISIAPRLDMLKTTNGTRAYADKTDRR